jgi:uncharacterized protein (TIRG00374 family)
MKKYGGRALQFVLLLIGIILTWHFFSQQNIDEVIDILSAGHYGVVFPIFIISLLVYIFRALRWQLLLKASGQNARFIHIFSAVSISYMVSFFIPRLGELIRCAAIQQKEQVPISTSIGTVIVERMVDIVCLLLAICLAIFIQFDEVYNFFYTNIWKPMAAIHSASQLLMLISILLVVGMIGVMAYIKFIHRSANKYISEFKTGLWSIKALASPSKFVALTLLIWICYFFMTYLWFYIFEETTHLSVYAGLTIFAIGTIGRSVPINGGGMGAYHYLVGQALLVYGVSSVYGNSLAILIHGGQTIFTFVIGLPAWLLFSLGRKQKSI